MSTTLYRTEMTNGRRPRDGLLLFFKGLFCVILAAPFVLVLSDMFLPRHGLIQFLYTDAELAEQDANAAMLKTLTTFKVICPSKDFDAENESRWIAYAAKQRWTPYPAAGRLCYDP